MNTSILIIHVVENASLKNALINVYGQWMTVNAAGHKRKKIKIRVCEVIVFVF